MSITNLGPYPITGVGQQITVVPSGQYGGPDQLGDVLLTNQSGYTLGLNSSSDGTLLNLLPGQVNVFPVPRNGGSLVATVLYGTAATTVPTLQAQIALMGESFAGSYPYTVSLPNLPYLALGFGDDVGFINVYPSPSATGIYIVSPVLPDMLTQVLGLISVEEGAETVGIALPITTIVPATAAPGTGWFYAPVAWLPLGLLAAVSVPIYYVQPFWSAGSGGPTWIYEVDSPTPLNFVPS